MREVEADRFVQASPSAVYRFLSPQRVVETEGTFTVADVEQTDRGTVVMAAGPGIAVPLRFEYLENGLRYVAEGDVGPFDHLETEVTVEQEGNGSRITMRSTVSLNVPLPLVDCIAGWKRRRELDRALDEIAADVS
jgi:hypothetical protein